MKDDIIKEKIIEVILQKFVWTEDDLSVFMGVTLYTLRKWRTTGEGPKYHKFGGGVRYIRREVFEYLADRCFQSTSSRATSDIGGCKDE